MEVFRQCGLISLFLEEFYINIQRACVLNVDRYRIIAADVDADVIISVDYTIGVIADIYNVVDIIGDVTEISDVVFIIAKAAVMFFSHRPCNIAS